MKAVQVNSYGSAEVLQYIEVNPPIPQADQVLVQVKASSVNPVDWKIRRGDLKLLSGWRFPKGLGADFAGIVAEVGSNIQDYQVGDEIYGFVNPLKGGAYAQYLTVSAETVALKSSHLSFQQAAAIPIAGLTALQSLCDLGQVQSGMTVLVNGASGGVGTFAIQVAKALGTEVTGVCSGKNVELVYELGADRVIDYKQQNFIKEGRKYDIIFDAVAKCTFSECLSCLTHQGVYITTLPTINDAIPILKSLVLPSKKAKIIMVQPKSKDLRKLTQLIEADKIKVVIDRVFLLSEIVQAHQYSETKRAVGKIVLSLDEN